LVKKDDDIYIYLNAVDSFKRKRFTIAHELGQYFLHLDAREKFVDLKRDHEKNDMELEADEFAGCLLMDETEVKSRFDKSKNIGLSNQIIIDLLAGIFVVSSAAMYTRLKRLESI
jgi:Zn-dependent peptidase ImmA (M78 family)